MWTLNVRDECVSSPPTVSTFSSWRHFSFALPTPFLGTKNFPGLFFFPHHLSHREPATCPSNSPAARPLIPLSLPSQHLPPSFRNLWSALCHYTHGRSHPSIKFSSFLSRQAALDTFSQGGDATSIGFVGSCFKKFLNASVFFIASLQLDVIAYALDQCRLSCH